jgi:hypothetical protein
MNNEEKIRQLEKRLAILERRDYGSRARTQELVFIKNSAKPETSNVVIGDQGSFTLAKIPPIYLIAEYQGKLYKLYASLYDGDI